MDRAKTILIQRNGLSEPDTHALLRRTAMNQARRIVDIAETLVIANALLQEHKTQASPRRRS